MAKRLWRIHSVLGLFGGLFLIAIGLSGSALVFADELTRLFHPRLTHVSSVATAPLDYDRIHAGVRARWPDAWSVRFRRLPQAPDESVQMALSRHSDRMQDDWFHVFVDPGSGEILGEKHALGRYGFSYYPMDWLLWFHYSLHLEKAGELVVSIMSVVLFASATTGLWLYRRQFWRGLLLRMRWRESGPRRRWANVHAVVGVWSVLLNLVLAITGFWMTRYIWSPESFQQPVKAAFNPPAPAPAVPYNIALENVARDLPSFIPVGISAIGNPTSDYQIYGRLRSEPLILGASSSEITIDGLTGAVKKKNFVSERSVVDRINAAVIPLHFGNFGGLPVKLLWAAGGLAPGVLAISGVLILRTRSAGTRRLRVVVGDSQASAQSADPGSTLS